MLKLVNPPQSISLIPVISWASHTQITESQYTAAEGVINPRKHIIGIKPRKKISGGRLGLLDDSLSSLAYRCFHRNMHVVTVGGPCNGL